MKDSWRVRIIIIFKFGLLKIEHWGQKLHIKEDGDWKKAKKEFESRLEQREEN